MQVKLGRGVTVECGDAGRGGAVYWIQLITKRERVCASNSVTVPAVAQR